MYVKAEFDEAIMTEDLPSYIRSLCPGLTRQKRDLYLKVIWQSTAETFSWIYCTTESTFNLYITNTVVVAAAR